MSLGDVWNANIFHPEPLALSFSEHLFGQVLQILPVYHLTGQPDPLLQPAVPQHVRRSPASACTCWCATSPGRHSCAAFVAGLIYAFVPFRIAQIAHIQSLSSQWMPLALYGFRRFIGQRQPRVQPAPAGPRWRHRRAADAELVVRLLPDLLRAVCRRSSSCIRSSPPGAAARPGSCGRRSPSPPSCVAAGTWPFLALYLEAQRVHGFERPLGEVVSLLGRRLQLPHRARGAAAVGTDVLQRVPEAGRRAVSRLRADRCWRSWPCPRRCAEAAFSVVGAKATVVDAVAPLAWRRVAVLIVGVSRIASCRRRPCRHSAHRRFRDLGRRHSDSRDQRRAHALAAGDRRWRRC